MENKRSGTMLGGTSLIMIFVIVSLTTFSLLSLVTANADYKLSKKAAAAVSAYYAADSQAEEKLYELIEGIRNKKEQTIEDICSKLNVMVVEEAEQEKTLFFQTPITQTQRLEIFVRIYAPFDGEKFTIDSWKAVNTNTGEYGTEYIELWDGKTDGGEE